MNKVRVRFAPSPTGFLHIGGLRSALYNFLFARKNNGDMLLRIEDTDRKRYVEGAIENLLKTLEWAGITIDEKPLVQSERLEIYKKYTDQLVKEGKAYYCFCTPERLEEMRQECLKEKRAPLYDRHCLDLSEEEIRKNLEDKIPYVIRMKIPHGETIEVDDLIRGKISFKTDLVDDQIILKSDGFPTYHLASVADDQEMKITHVIRGEEWLPSVPKHILLYKYFGWEAPKFAHLPLLLNPDKSKLSKRQGDVAVEDYIKKGYLKEAIINFVALLGWNPGEGSTQEIFSLEELIQKFDLTHVHKAGAVFDIKKLDWINSEYIKKLSVDELYKKALEFLPSPAPHPSPLLGKGEGEERERYLKKVLAIEQDRLNKLSEVGESNKFFFQDVDANKELLCWKNMTDEELKNSLEKSKNILESISEENWTRENLEKVLMEESKENRGALLWPLRAALTGEQKSPSPFDVAWVLGKVESLKRVEKALAKI